MTFQKEYFEEIKKMLTDLRVISCYDEEVIYSELYTYWNNKPERDLWTAENSEYTKQFNDFISETKKLSKQEKRTLIHLLHKKFKYYNK
jgi:hypothetical protein